MQLIRRYFLALVPIFILVAAGFAEAALVSWNVAAGGSWNNGANWDTTTIPTSSDIASFGAILPAGASAITLDGDQTVQGVIIGPGSGKQVTISSGTPTTSKIILLSTNDVTDFALSATNGGAHNLAAPVQLGNGSSGSFTATFNSFVNGSNFVINGAISESPGQTWGVKIVGNNSGIVNYGTTANPKTYSGDTTITTTGILKLNNDNVVPDGAGKGNIVIEGSGQLQVNNTNETINGLSSASSTSLLTRLGTNSRGLTLGNNNATASFAGNVTNTTASSSGNGYSLTKIGSGTQTFSGTINGFNGAIAVNAGTLLVNGTHSPTTNAGATLNTANGYNVASAATLGGNGTINPGTGGGVNAALANSLGVTIQNGGTIAPGASAGSVGTLTINIPLALNDTSFASFELTGTNTSVGGAANDLITGVTNLTLNGTLNVAETVAGSFLSAVAGNQWRLINYSGTLTNNGLVLGTMPALSSGLEFAISVATAGQVNLVVNAIPEPGAFLFGGLVCVMMGTAYALRRRREPELAVVRA